MQDGMGAVVRHLRTHSRILEANHRDGARHGRTREQLLDAGAGAEECLQAIVLIEEFLARRGPRDRVVRAARGSLTPDIDLSFGQFACQRVAPTLTGSGIVVSDYDTHAG